MKLVSIARNASHQVDRYIAQVQALRERMPVDVVIAEGDSADDTYERLCAADVKVLKVEHGGPQYGSHDVLERWRQLAAVCNVALTVGRRDLQPDENLIYVEFDLLWSPETMEKLNAHLSLYPAVSPMSMHNGRFYDVWGYRKNGDCFPFHPPYFPGWSDTMMHQIDSSGSCFALSNTAAQVAHFGHDDCVLGIGRSIREAGLSLWLDPTLEVTHP